LRRLLRSAERFSDAAMALGLPLVKTPRSSVSASLFSVTFCDQRFFLAADFFGGRFFALLSFHHINAPTPPTRISHRLFQALPGLA